MYPQLRTQQKNNTLRSYMRKYGKYVAVQSSFRIFLTVLYLMNLTLIRNARAYLVSKKVMHFYSDHSDKEKSDVACGAN